MGALGVSGDTPVWFLAFQEGSRNTRERFCSGVHNSAPNDVLHNGHQRVGLFFGLLGSILLAVLVFVVFPMVAIMFVGYLLRKGAKWADMEG